MRFVQAPFVRDPAYVGSSGGTATRLWRSTLVRFAVVSLVPAVVLGAVLSTASKHAMYGHAANVYATMSNGIVKVTADALVEPADLDVSSPGPAPHAAALKALLARMGAPAGVLRVRVVRPDGTVALSTADDDIGTRVALDSGFRAALAGHRSARISHDRSFPVPGRSHQVIEVVLPLRLGPDPLVRGVVQATGVDQALLGAINSDVHRMQLILAVGLAMLWLCSVPIAISVSRQLHRVAVANEYLALHDTLTGLPNRILFDDRLDHAIAGGVRNATDVGVLLIDLDGFKAVNDTFGHAAGDELLVEVARRLAAAVRDCDTVARFGGDEFAIVAEQIHGEPDLRSLGDRVTATLHDPVGADRTELRLGASVGACMYPSQASSAEELVRFADVAMYQAKGSHEPLVIYRHDRGDHGAPAATGANPT